MTCSARPVASARPAADLFIVHAEGGGHALTPQKPVHRPIDIYAVRAKSEGEALAHSRTRYAFLGFVLPDSRTRNLFAWWGHSTGIDRVVEDMTALLDVTAQRAGLAHRSALRSQDHAFHLAPVLGVLQRHEAEYERLLAETRDERGRFAVGWVVAELFGGARDEDVPIRAWLASDVMTIFRWEIAARAWGDQVRLIVGHSSTINTVGKGKRPMHGGKHLEEYASWFYRAEVAVPRVTHAELARERYAALAAAGTFLGPKAEGSQGHHRARGYEGDPRRYRGGEAPARARRPAGAMGSVLQNSGVITGGKLPCQLFRVSPPSAHRTFL